MGCNRSQSPESATVAISHHVDGTGRHFPAHKFRASTPADQAAALRHHRSNICMFRVKKEHYFTLGFQTSVVWRALSCWQTPQVLEAWFKAAEFYSPRLYVRLREEETPSHSFGRFRLPVLKISACISIYTRARRTAPMFSCRGITTPCRQELHFKRTSSFEALHRSNASAWDPCSRLNHLHTDIHTAIVLFHSILNMTSLPPKRGTNMVISDYDDNARAARFRRSSELK